MKQTIKILTILNAIICFIVLFQIAPANAAEQINISQHRSQPISTLRNSTDAQRYIGGIHTKVFGKNNLLTSKFTADEEKEWMQMLKDIKEFSDKTAKDKSLTSGKWSAYETLFDISQRVINGLKISYNSQIAAAFRDPKYKASGISDYDPQKIDVNKLDMRSLKNILDNLLPFKLALEKLQKDLKQSKAKKSKAVQDAYDLFARIALTLEVTIDKISADLKKIK